MATVAPWGHLRHGVVAGVSPATLQGASTICSFTLKQSRAVSPSLSRDFRKITPRLFFHMKVPRRSGGQPDSGRAAWNPCGLDFQGRTILSAQIGGADTRWVGLRKHRLPQLAIGRRLPPRIYLFSLPRVSGSPGDHHHSFLSPLIVRAFLMDRWAGRPG